MAESRRPSRTDRRQVEGPAPEIERRSPTPRELELRLERKTPTHWVLHVANELVSHNYYLLDETLERLSPFESGLVLELDLSRVPYADSEALGRLHAWAKKLARDGAKLLVADPAPYVTSILEVLRLDSVLDIVYRHAGHPEGEGS